MVRNLVAAALLVSGSAGAQTHDVEQLNADGDPRGPIQQIGEPAPALVSEMPAPSLEPGLPQISTRTESESETPQLSQGDIAVPSPAQLSRDGRTAQPSAPLSTPRDGRTGAVARVEGKDRCDAAPERREARIACARVIETRAAEFERPDPATLSPEQRLLVEQQITEENDARSAARRLTSTAIDPDSLDQQSIAAIALRRDQREEPLEEPKPEEAAAALDNILGTPLPGSGPQ